MTYKIKNWDKYYENNRSREIQTTTWVPMPNSHDGDGYTQLLEHKNGTAHFGAWCLLVQVASKCDERGTLLRSNGKPHTAGTLSRMTRSDERVFKELLPRLIEIGWIEEIEPISQAGEIMPQTGAEQPQIPAQKERRNELKESICAFPFNEFWEAYGKKIDRAKTEKAYSKLSEKDLLALKEKLPHYIQATPEVQYRKNPLTYLNGNCWLDELPVNNAPIMRQVPEAKIDHVPPEDLPTPDELKAIAKQGLKL